MQTPAVNLAVWHVLNESQESWDRSVPRCVLPHILIVGEQATYVKVFSKNAVAFWVQKWTEMCKQEDGHHQFYEFFFSNLQLEVQAATILKVTKLGQMLSPSDTLKQLNI